jgi:protein-tyrosine-phosphatase
VTDPVENVLFLHAGNPARSILAAALIGHWGSPDAVSVEAKAREVGRGGGDAKDQAS